VRHLADNPVYPFLVTGSAVTPRRTVVELSRCNSCHQTLEFHGGNRRTPDYCVMCHNPAFVSDEPPSETGTLSLPSLNFKDLIHGLHSQGHYPDALERCSQCHVDGTAELPLSPELLPSLSLEVGCNEDPIADADDACAEANVVELGRTELPAAAAACLSCHESASAAAHAEVNTTAAGAEACATCHQNGRSEGLDVVHALAP
jgi:OmcA/MtrC family decaheme c-type cytochrome